ncbi:DapH/DapD/GlmU-related protein [Enterococcus pseudoavium]|uniref:Serine acetyltransferase n=1 Tax=Enterococcus pseudoavium TaxID=44007 RepID=A0ABU3FKE3_9ENTE|nr:DapH/DapD/GlmU-related protein [Enterococcus pseudoavium]MDT2771483.1 DapH/DapD/GlmU-related protein [Enterococcus pseudoavium]
MNNRSELQKVLDIEFENQMKIKRTIKNIVRMNILCIAGHEQSLIVKYKSFLRKAEYYHGNEKRIRYGFYMIKKERMGRKLKINIPIHVFDEGLEICHASGGIVVAKSAKIGKNASIHPGITIGGNSRNGREPGKFKAPQIGDNVAIGPGSRLLGGIKLGNNVTIGANSVLVKSIDGDNLVITGAPGRVLRKNV